jgi:hypothetical protein
VWRKADQGPVGGGHRLEGLGLLQDRQPFVVEGRVQGTVEGIVLVVVFVFRLEFWEFQLRFFELVEFIGLGFVVFEVVGRQGIFELWFGLIGFVGFPSQERVDPGRDREANG